MLRHSHPRLKYIPRVQPRRQRQSFDHHHYFINLRSTPPRHHLVIMATGVSAVDRLSCETNEAQDDILMRGECSMPSTTAPSKPHRVSRSVGPDKEDELTGKVEHTPILKTVSRSISP
jgi:hypothetical protein